MTKVLPYKPQVKTLWASPEPFRNIWRACSNTQKGVFATDDLAVCTNPEGLIKYLVRADHGSVLEHAVISFEISQTSRSCADQLRTHRMTSPTMSSTHYQSHADYCHRVHPDMIKKGLEIGILDAHDVYVEALNYLPTGEARQSLPLSTEVRYIVTANLRSWLNFLKHRLCLRNTVETVIVAYEISKQLLLWMPELKPVIGLPCNVWRCSQGALSCSFAADSEYFIHTCKECYGQDYEFIIDIGAEK